MLFHLTFGLFWIVIAYKWGDWRNWKKYYPTILFFWCGDILYYSLFHHYPLWLYYSPGVPYLFVEMFYKLMVSSSAVILFFTYYPGRPGKQILYLFFWVALYTVMELGIHTMGYFPYFNGWSTWWSAFVNIIMFSTFKLHYHHPIPAWLVYFFCISMLAYLFGLSLEHIW